MRLVISVRAVDGAKPRIEMVLHDGAAKPRIDGATLDCDPDGYAVDQLTDPELDGVRLLDAVAPPATKRRAIWDTARRHGAAEVVLDIQSDRFDNVAWEIIGDGSWYPFRDGRGSAVRVRPGSVEKAEWRPPASELQRIAPPLHVMVVMGDLDDEIGWSELKNIHCGLGMHAYEWYVHPKPMHERPCLVRPTRLGFLDRLDLVRPHVLHVVGHGVEVGDGFAIGMRPEGTPDFWTFDRGIVSNIQNRQIPAPRVVVLNGCDTASGNNATVKALLDAGCEAVVAMAGEVDTAENGVFIEEFYRVLAQRGGVARAVALARDRLCATAPREGHWARPRLIVARDPARILPIAGRGVARMVKDHSGDIPEFRRLMRMIDRSDARKAVLDALSGSTASVIAIAGDAEDRKDVAKSCLAVAIANGSRAVRVELSPEGGAESAPASRPRRGVITGEKFAETVRSSLQARARDKRADRGDDPLVAASLRGGHRHYADLLEDIRTSDDGSPLLLFLENVSEIREVADFQQHFLWPLASSREGDAGTPRGRVCVVLVEDGVWLEENLEIHDHADVPSFKKGDAAALTREFIARRRFTEDEWAEVSGQLLDWASQQLASESRPERFSVREIYAEARALLKDAGIEDPFFLDRATHPFYLDQEMTDA